MILAGRPAKILLIDTNVYFSKRLSDALKREGFEVNASTQPAFALTTLEYDTPSAIVCSTNMREMGALDIARMIRADARNAALPVIALGDGSQRALMEAFQAGCDDYIDRTRPPAIIATHIKNIIVSKAEGFQPTQMLTQSDTSLSGSLTHHDLPGVMQMLGHAHQTGALHINAGSADALLFFDAGTITHAECGSLFGDEAVIHILKSCFQNNSGVYKFVYGSSSSQRTVLRSATDLMLDAMRELDESTREPQADLSAVPPANDTDTFLASLDTTSEAALSETAEPVQEMDHSVFAPPEESPAAEKTDEAPAIASLLETAAEESVTPQADFPAYEEPSEDLHSDDSEVIASLIDRYAAAPTQNNSESDLFADLPAVSQSDDNAEVEASIEFPPVDSAIEQAETVSLDEVAEVSQPQAESHVEASTSIVSSPFSEPSFAAEHSEDSFLNDHAEIESFVERAEIAPAFETYESNFPADNAEPSLLDCRSEVESLIDRPAIMHSNSFSAAALPDGTLPAESPENHLDVAPSCVDSSLAPVEHSPAMETPADDLEFAAAPEVQPEAEPKVDLSAVVNQVFQLAVAPQADNSADEAVADRPADQPEKESL